jgi:hypothetical protein
MSSGSPVTGVSTPTLLTYKDIVDVNMDENNDVNFADTGNYGHRIQIPIGRSLFNLFFRWRRNIGQDRPHAKITTSDVVKKTFKTVMINAFNTNYTDIDGVSGGLHFGTANMSLNTDPRLRKNGLVSANDIPMAFVLYRLYGNSSFSTKNYILNLEDAHDMLTSGDLADAIMNSFITHEADALDKMFIDLLSQDPKRYFTTTGVSEPNLFERNTDLAGEGTWNLTPNDIIEIKTKLVFHSKVTKRGVAGREHLLSDVNSAENQQNIIIPDDYFFVRIQLKVVDDGIVADPTNLTYSDGTQTVVTGYIGTINGEIVIPDGVTSIANGAFTGQTGLTSILIPQSLITIGDEAFKTTGLQTVFMPNVTTIGDRAFMDCPSLTTIIAPKLISIGSDAFADDIDLVSFNSYSYNNPSNEPFMDINETNTNTNIIVTQNIINLNGITALGEGTFAGCESIEEVVIPTTITSIPARLFSDTPSLTNIVIPTSITSIGGSAFAGAGLTSITLHSGITSIGPSVFANASNLESVTILAPITTLPAGIFSGASNLTNVELPSTVEVIASGAFSGTAITTLTLPNVKSIGANAFAGVTTLVSVSTPSIESVSATAFSGATNLQDAPADPSSIVFSDSSKTVLTGYTGSVGILKLPSTVTTIADNAFLNNLNIIGLDLGGSVIQTIGNNAFKGSGLRTLTLPSGLTSIGNNAFQNCVNLTTLTIPPAETMSFGNYCFAGCSKLTSINIPNGVTSIPIHCFNGCALMTTVTSHSGITSIGEYAFNGCAALTSFTIPSGVTTLPPYSFAGCSSLTSLTLPTNLTIYQTGCLSGTGLTSVTFPEVTTTNIGNEVLANCTALTSVTFPNKPPTGGIFPLTLGTGILKGCSALTSFIIPDQWTSLTTSFFENSGLTSITVPSTITAMGTSVFKGCSGLTTATIDAQLDTLPASTFQNCTSLATVSLASSIVTINTSAFQNSRIVAFINTFVTTVRDFAFADNPALTTLDALNVTSLAITSISGTPNLSIINLSNLPSSLVHFRASSYSGSGSWTNDGTLGATHNATVSSGTPVKNSAGNGVVFNANLRFAFPVISNISVYSQSVWIKRTGIARTIMSQQNNSTGNWVGTIVGNSSRGFISQFRRAAVTYSGGIADVDVNTWCHLVFVWSGTFFKTYLNGALINTTPLSSITAQQNGAQYYIGANWDGSLEFQGELGELRFYDIALTDDQVKFINVFTANGFPNPPPAAPEMKIRFTASSYSGSGAWTNQGTLGSTHNATVNSGTPSKNSTGNGIIFQRNLRFAFPSIGPVPNYTQSVWLKRTSYAGTVLSQQTHASNTRGPGIWSNSSRQFYPIFSIANVSYTGASAETDLDIWYNLTVTFNGSSMVTYLNGIMVGRANLSGRFVEVNDNSFYIGADWTGALTFHGEIGEVRMYDGALTAAEVLSIYNTTVTNYPNTTAPREMKIRFVANNYSGTGAWTNEGTLGTTHNATVQVGTPSKNTEGNGVVFNRNLRFGFPNIGFLKTFTYSVWIRRSLFAGAILSQQTHASTNNGPQIISNGVAGFQIRFRTTNVDTIVGVVDTELYTWYNITYVFNGINMLTYLNGALMTNSNIAGRYVETSENQYYIGANWDGTSEFAGEIGEIRMYNGVLTANEVTSLYTSTADNYPNPPLPTEMRIRFVASNYSGSGAWTNEGTLGSTHNASVQVGTPSKNTIGNGVIFSRNLRFGFPTIGGLKTYTQSVWIKRNLYSGSVITQERGGLTNVGPGINSNSGRFFSPRFRTNVTDYWGAGLETDVNTWYNLTFVYDGSNLISYLNGINISSVPMIGRFLEATNNQYFIGANWDGTAEFSGELGELRFYNGALTASEVLEIYTSTSVNYPNPAPNNEMLICFTANTYSGSGDWENTGTLGSSFNAVVHAGTPSKNGNGIVFDGGLTYRFPSIKAISQYTIFIWFMRTNTTKALLAQQNDGAITNHIGPYIVHNNSRIYYGRYRVNNVDYTGGGVDTEINTWHNLVITYDTNFMASYLDGRLIDKTRMNVPIEVNNNQYFIGADRLNADRFIGRIGEVRIYNYALEETVIKTLYDSTNSLYLTPPPPITPSADMVIHFRASDYSGSGAWINNGTLGTANNAAIQFGTPTKNTAGNGIIFNANLRFGFPNIGAFTNFTVSLWIKRTGLASIVMTQQGISSNSAIFIQNLSNRSFGGRFQKANVFYGGNGVETERNTWQHLTFVWTGTQMISYLNGNLQTVSSTGGVVVDPTDSGGQYYIGATTNATNTFVGEIGEIRIYKGILNDTMVQDIYSSTVADYPNSPAQPAEMRVRLLASNYSGSGAWTNEGTLGVSHNATVQMGSVSKNASGNGVIFNGALRMGFPEIGVVSTYTQSIWFKRYGVANTIISQQTLSSNFIGGIEGNSTRFFRPYYLANSVTCYGGNIETDPETWYNITTVWDGSNLLTYLNGTLRASIKQNSMPESNGSQYYIGANHNGIVTFWGEIGEIRMYTGVLTDSEIANIYNTTVANYPNVSPQPEMKIRYLPSSYSGSGALENLGTLGSSHNATIRSGTPSKNAAGNGIVFNANLVYQFPQVGSVSSHTVSVWIKRSSVARTFFTQQNGSSLRASYIEGANNQYFGRFFYNGGIYSGTGVTVLPEIWYNLTIVWDGTYMNSYLNGILQSSIALPGLYSESNGLPYFIGGTWDGSAQHIGEIGEFRFYTGALSHSAVAQIYTTTMANYTNISIPTEMKIRYLASDYSGTGALTNLGTLGSSHNATIRAGTPSKNTAGNGIVFNGGLVFQFNSIGTVSSYTQSIWVKRTNTARIIISQQNVVSNFGPAIQALNTRFFDSRSFFAGGWWAGPSIETDQDTWVNLIFVWSGLEMFVYRDGVLETIRTISLVATENNSAQYFLGGDQNGAAQFIGEIGEFRMYNGAIDASEVTNIYNTGLLLYPNPPVATELKIHYVGSTYSGSGSWINNGTLGSTHDATIRSGTPSKSGNGIVFNGGLVFQFPTVGNLARYTVSLWIKRTTATIGVVMAQQNSANNFPLYIQGNNTTSLQPGIYYNSAFYAGGSVNLTDLDVWYQITYVWNGQQMKSFLNGILFNITNLIGVHAEQSGVPYFIGGTWTNGVATFTGQIGEFRLYNGALSDIDIFDLYNSTAPSFV